MRLLSTSTLALLLATAPPANGALINSLTDGLWYCAFPSSSCSFDSAVPGATDVVRINHNVTYWGQGANPVPPMLTQIDGLQLPAGGFLGIYEGRALWVTGNSSFEGGRMDGALNGGGSFENRGTLEVSATSGVSINGTLATNRGVWRVLPGAHFEVALGGGSFFTNSQGAGGTAVLELQGGSTTLISNVGKLLNLGIVRKTGATAATISGTWRNVVDGIDGGTLDIQQGELLLSDVTSPFPENGVIEAVDGIRLLVAPGAQLRVAAGGQYRMLSTNGSAVVHDLSGGGKLVLDAGGELLSDSTSAVLDFDPGEFEFRGGIIFGSQVRNDGTITVAGGGTPSVRGLDNAGSVIVPSGQTLSVDGRLNNLLAGTLEVHDGASLAGTSFVFNSGVLAKRGGSGTGTIASGAYDNRGSPGMLVAQTGTLERRGASDGIAGTLWVMQGARYRHTNDGGSLIGEWMMPGSQLLGSGTFDATGVLLQAIVEPGDQGVGVLTFSGTLEMQHDTLLRFEIGGSQSTQVDRMVVPAFVSNTAAGTLVARFISGFDPRQGQRFPLIQTSAPPALLPNLQFEGLHPGFAAHLEVNGGFIELVADSNGINLDTMFRNGFEGP